MFENWFDHINAYLVTHPHALAHLMFLLRLKSWILTGIMLFFLYLVYKEQRKPAPQRKPQAHYFVA